MNQTNSRQNGSNIKKNRLLRLRWLTGGARPLSASQTKLLDLFFGVTVAGAVLGLLIVTVFYIYALAAKHNGSESFDWLLGIFSDFVFIMNTSIEESPYITEQSSYPPTAIILLLPFALICKNILGLYSNETMTLEEFTSKLIQHPEFWAAYLTFVTVCGTLAVLIIVKKYRLAIPAALKAGVTVILSAPLFFTVMRGNTIFFALVLVLAFLLFYDSPSPLLRELALFCLAFAGAVKIYPLFFGVFLLKRRKLFASARVACYFLVIILVSFLILNGGFGSFDEFLENLGSFASNDNRLVANNNLSAGSILYRAIHIFSPALADSTGTNAAIIVLSLAIFVLATLTALTTSSDFTRSVIVSAAIILIPTVSYFYVLIFILPALMEFIRASSGMKKAEKRMYTVLFAFILFIPFQLHQFYLLHSAAVITMLIYEARRVIKYELLPKASTSTSTIKR